MYLVDERDRVRPLPDVPQSSVGAPCPVVLSSEELLSVAFLLQNTPAGWDGSTVWVLEAESGGEPAAVVRFLHPLASMFGPPNDEAFSGHPLASRGLTPYGAFEILDSSWLRLLEHRNKVHEHHRPEQYAEFRHFVLTFHDSTFECIAHGYEISVGASPLTRLLLASMG